MDYDLVVVGGGPAGMLSAAMAGAKGQRVILLEKNDKLGKKLCITGNGRCNVTNYGDFEDFKNNIVNNEKFLYSSLRTFSNYDLIEILQSLGVKTKVEPDNRVFPESDQSSDVINALQKLLQANKVQLKFNAQVKKVLVREGRVCGILWGDNNRVEGKVKGKVEGKKVLLATGGMSYRQTGSTGDGYKMAQSLGHSIVQIRPALIPLEILEPWVKELQGLTMNNVKIQAIVGKRVIAEQLGEILFTHFGVSGPAILRISSYINKFLDRSVILKIDFMPDLSNEQLDGVLQRDFKKSSGKQLKNALDELLPRRIIPVMLAVGGLDAHKQVDHIAKKEREQLVRALKGTTLTIKGTRPLNEAIVTSGGINTKEINPSTLESKIIKGLFFAGEIIDVDALTGGYNLQIAFSTGYLSGIRSAENEIRP